MNSYAYSSSINPSSAYGSSRSASAYGQFPDFESSWGHTAAHGARRKFWQAPVAHDIKHGDRIFVRVMRDGKTLLEFSVNNAGSLTDLIGEIRYAARNIVGLTTVFIRNHDRGWSETRPIKFYADGGVRRRRSQTNNVKSNYAASPTPINRSAARMAFPWETH